MDYIYLHGFASSPHSAKAKYLRDRFRSRQLQLHIPDLNQSNFSALTLTRQLHQIEAVLPPDSTPVTILGSSFGGLTAAWLGQRQPRVQRLVLLAPAFQFLDHWLPQLGAEQLETWRTQGYYPVYHYGEGRSLPLSYEFVRDNQQYREDQIQRPVPTLILHGRRDEVIPIAASRRFAAARPWVQLIAFDSDHTLASVMGQIWQAIQEFCQLSPR